jgi:hypothetical protein
VKAVEGPEVAINIAVPTMPAKTPTEILRENMVTLRRSCEILAIVIASTLLGAGAA